MRKRKGKNPAAGDAFKRCVRKVAAKGSAYDPKAVCAVAGRKKYGAKKFQAMAAAGKKKKARARRRNPLSRFQQETKISDLGYKRGLKVKGHRSTAGSLPRWAFVGGRIDPGLSALYHASFDRGRNDPASRYSRAVAKQWPGKKNTGRRRRNPEDAAAERYEFFHGRPPQEVVEVTEHLHEHTVLSGIGKLKKLIVLAVDGETKVTLENFKGAILAQDEEGTQLFIKGGDQQVNLADFGIRGKKPHENEVLGAGLAIAYDTTKIHLGKDGGKAIYDHEFGKRSTRLPIMTYDTRNHLIFFAGGGYDLPEVGIRG
jgi:hypothetical protein